MKRNVELRQERGRIHDEMGRIVPEGRTSNLTSAEKEKFDRLDCEFRRLTNEIAIIENGFGSGDAASRLPEGSFMGAQREQRTGYNKSFHGYLTRGIDGMSAEDRSMLVERRASIGVEGTPSGGAYPGSTAGFVVPVGFEAAITASMKFVQNMTPACRQIVSDVGAPLSIPLSDDTANTGELVSEAAPTSTLDVPTGLLVLGSYRYSSKTVKISIEALTDAGIDIEDFLAEVFGWRIGRITGQHFLTGTGGGSQPTGLLTGMTAASCPSVLAAGAGDTDGASAANTVGYDDLVATQHKLDRAYRERGSWLMADSTLSQIMMTKDKYGHPIYRPSLTENEPDRLLGKPVLIHTSMPELQTGASSPAVTNTVAVYGDFSRFAVRKCGPTIVLRLNELFAVNGQVGFIAYQRWDSGLLDAKAFVSLHTTY